MRKKIIIVMCIIVVLILGATGCSKEKNVSATTTKSVTTETFDTDASINTYMKTNNLTLKAEDVQLDIANNLNKDFAIEGIAKLSDNYNYGYSENNFCIIVNTDDTTENSWYLYCNKTDLSKLYDSLQNGNKYITATCQIKKSLYKEGRGNLAIVSNIEWK